MPPRRTQDTPAPHPGRGGTKRSRPRRPPPSRAKPEAEVALPPISLEAILWGTLLVVAFALRLARLDALPLTLDESSRAFAAFRVSEGSVPAGWSGDLTSTLTALLFTLFGASDLVARIVPALAGGALVGAFWFTGRYVGRGAALVAAALVALSPLAILVSRSALPFSLGALVSLGMVLSLFAYLREQRLLHLSALVALLALAPAVDGVATAAAVAVAVFLVIEGVLRRERNLERAFAAFRVSAAQQRVAGIIIVSALLLGFSHFGTSFDRLGLAGLTQWADMFANPSDGRAWAYPKFLAAYDWPLVLAGGLGLVVAGRRVLGGGRVALIQRFLLLWAVVALITMVLTTRREPGQLLILLLPLAMLAGPLIVETASALDWSVLRRAWLPLLAALLLTAYALLVLTEWSQARASETEKTYVVLALVIAAGLLAASFPVLGRDAAALALTASAALAAVFLVHSSLSIVLADGSESAAGSRASENVEAFVDTVARAGAGASGPIMIDSRLKQPLQWYFRDEPVAFGDAVPDAAVYVGPADAAPPGFAAQGAAWRLAEGHYPSGVSLLNAWRWLLYRTPIGSLSSTDATIFLPQP